MSKPEPPRRTASPTTSIADDSDSNVSDLALVERCIEGDQRAWAALVQQHETTVRYTAIRALRRYGAPARDAVVEDIASDVFLSLIVDDCHRLRSFSGRARLSTWLRVIVANRVIDHLRKQRPTVPIEPDPTLPGVDPPDTRNVARTVELADLRERLSDFWDELSDADREFAMLFFVHELSFAAIAAQLDTSRGALYARKNRIRKQLVEYAAENGWFDAGEGAGTSLRRNSARQRERSARTTDAG